jgi:hypothetical protein
MFYHFDTNDAVKYGVDAAIIISHFRYWITHNKAHGINFHKNRTWTFSTLEALQKLFPFWTVKQIWTILNKLIKQKIIVKAEFNKDKRNRTKWYAFCNESDFLSPQITQVKQPETPQPAPEIIPDLASQNENVEFPDVDAPVSQMGNSIGKIQAEKDNRGINTRARSLDQKKRKSANLPIPYSDEFLQFWENFPELDALGSKQGAWASWQNLVATNQLPDVPALLEIARAQADEALLLAQTRRRSVYFRHVVTWLNQRGWEDKTIKVHVLPAAKEPEKRYKSYDEQLIESADEAIKIFLATPDSEPEYAVY